MHIEANGAIYDLELKKLDFESRDVRHDISFLCSNMGIEGKGAIYFYVHTCKSKLIEKN